MSPFIFKIPPILDYLETAQISASDKTAPPSGWLFAHDVAIDGTTAVVARDSQDSIHVYVFEKISGSWTEVQKLTTIASPNQSYFGSSVAISGNIIVVGERYGDQNGNINQGIAYIYEKNGTWPATETQKITASDGAASDQFGTSVAIDGNIVVIGSTWADPGGLTSAGSAYIYEKNGTWPATETQKITASDKAAEDKFGNSLAISGTIIVVGSYLSDPGGLASAGSAYIFEKAGTWPATETQKITASDGTATDQFGKSVAVDAVNNTIVIGANRKDVDGVQDVGAVYVYEKSGTWLEVQKLGHTGTHVAYELVGNSVAISNGIIVTAARYQPFALVYIKTGGTWLATESQILTTTSTESSEEFGISVDISNKVLIIGDRSADPAGLANAGMAFIFER